ncbi:MAG: hypothetical protein K8R17_09510, partial [Methanosarcinales archaeon]|nr:hypothetical protein [Methanosarcinales archaeon]
LDSIKNRTFSLEEAYAFEDILSDKYPNNHNIKDKIRQQLQYLRDLGLTPIFVSRLYSTRKLPF